MLILILSCLAGSVDRPPVHVRYVDQSNQQKSKTDSGDGSLGTRHQRDKLSHNSGTAEMIDNSVLLILILYFYKIYYILRDV